MLLNKSTLLAAVAALSLAKAEICNPLNDSGCIPEIPALGVSFAVDFTRKSYYFKDSGNSGNITYGPDGMTTSITKQLDNPSLKSTFYLMYGKFSAVMQAAPGQGIISSIFLQSDDLDEIDIEWTGGDTTQVQSNIFPKGNVTTYDRGGFHEVSNPQN